MSKLYWNAVQFLVICCLAALIAPACCHTSVPTPLSLLPPVVAVDNLQDLKPIERAHRATASILKGHKPMCSVVLVRNEKGKRLLALTADHCIQTILKSHKDGRKPLVMIGSAKYHWHVITEIVKRDERTDLALLRSHGLVTQSGAQAKLAKTQPAKASPVYVIGNPNHKEHNISKGILSNSLMYKKRHVYRTDADIWYGNSGGGMYNTDGELIGIVSFLEPAPGGCVVHGGSNATALPEVSKFLQEYLKQHPQQ